MRQINSWVRMKRAEHSRVIISRRMDHSSLTVISSGGSERRAIIISMQLKLEVKAVYPDTATGLPSLM